MQGHKTLIPDGWSIGHWTYSTTREMGGKSLECGENKGQERKEDMKDEGFWNGGGAGA